MVTSMIALLLSTSAAQVSTPAQPAAERRICRVQERLGTILPRRICRSASEWAQIDQAQNKITERDTNHMRNNSRGSLSEGPGTPGD